MEYRWRSINIEKDVRAIASNQKAGVTDLSRPAIAPRLRSAGDEKIEIFSLKQAGTSNGIMALVEISWLAMLYVNVYTEHNHRGN